MKRTVKLAACYALLIVCLIASAVLPFLTVISLSIASELYNWMPGISLNYQLYSPWLYLLPCLSALFLLPAWVKIVRSLNAGRKPGYRVLLAPWAALPINITLCLACAKGGPFFGASLVILPLLSVFLNVCAMILIGSVNVDDPE